MPISTENAVADATSLHLNNTVSIRMFMRAVNEIHSNPESSTVIVLGPSSNPTALALGKVLSSALHVPYVIHHADTDIGTVDDLVKIHDRHPGVIISSKPDRFLYDTSNAVRAKVLVNVFDLSDDPDRGARQYTEEELRMDIHRYIGWCVYFCRLLDGAV